MCCPSIRLRWLWPCLRCVEESGRLDRQGGRAANTHRPLDIQFVRHRPTVEARLGSRRTNDRIHRVWGAVNPEPSPMRDERPCWKPKGTSMSAWKGPGFTRAGARQCGKIDSGCLRTALPIVLVTPAENEAAQHPDGVGSVYCPACPEALAAFPRDRLAARLDHPRTDAQALRSKLVVAPPRPLLGALPGTPPAPSRIPTVSPWRAASSRSGSHPSIRGRSQVPDPRSPVPEHHAPQGVGIAAALRHASLEQAERIHLQISVAGSPRSRSRPSLRGAHRHAGAVQAQVGHRRVGDRAGSGTTTLCSSSAMSLPKALATRSTCVACTCNPVSHWSISLLRAKLAWAATLPIMRRAPAIPSACPSPAPRLGDASPGRMRCSGRRGVSA